jgi:hypothetical protein
MSQNPSLRTTKRDLAAALARGATAGIPIVGGLVAEVVNTIIPNQKIDRVVAFVELLAEQASAVQDRQALLESRLRTAEGSDLLEEGIVQASRALSDDRRRRIARLLLTGLTDAELQHDRVRRLFGILGSLTDSELVLLLYYSRTPTIASPWHQELAKRHPSVLRPPTREIGAPDSEVERAAMLDNYRRTLVGHGLLAPTANGVSITPLGRLLLRYAGDS